MLTEGLISPVRVETGSLRAPIEALQVCADDLLTVWGLDIEKHKTMTVPAILNPTPAGCCRRARSRSASSTSSAAAPTRCGC